MRISDWSSDVCSSDPGLTETPLQGIRPPRRRLGRCGGDREGADGAERRHQGIARAPVDEPARRLQMPELRLPRRDLYQDARILRKWREGARARGDEVDRKSTRLNSIHECASRMASSA